MSEGKRKTAARKKRVRVQGPVEPIKGYARIGWLCLRCDEVFFSDRGPEPFCPKCSTALEERQT